MNAYAKIAAVAAILVPAVPTAAHHSNSAYQVDQIVTLEGTVKEWRWMNPHTWLYITVEGEGGQTKEWAVEGRPPGILGRAGWSSTILKPGERVTVHASPAKNGDPEGIIARVTKADGTVLGNAPNYNREAAPAARPAAATAAAVGSRPNFAGVYYPAQQGGPAAAAPARRPNEPLMRDAASTFHFARYSGVSFGASAPRPCEPSDVGDERVGGGNGSLGRRAGGAAAGAPCCAG